MANTNRFVQINREQQFIPMCDRLSSLFTEYRRDRGLTAFVVVFLIEFDFQLNSCHRKALNRPWRKKKNGNLRRADITPSNSCNFFLSFPRHTECNVVLILQFGRRPWLHRTKELRVYDNLRLLTWWMSRLYVSSCFETRCKFMVIRYNIWTSKWNQN